MYNFFSEVKMFKTPPSGMINIVALFWLVVGLWRGERLKLSVVFFTSFRKFFWKVAQNRKTIWSLKALMAREDLNVEKTVLLTSSCSSFQT